MIVNYWPLDSTAGRFRAPGNTNPKGKAQYSIPPPSERKYGKQ